MIELQRRPQAALSGIDLRKRQKNMPQTPPYEEKIPLPEIKKKHRRKGSKASAKSAQDEDQHPRVKDVVSAYENTKDRRQIKRFLEKRRTLQQQSNIKRSSSLQQSIIVTNQKEAEKLISIDPYRSQQEIVRQQSPRLFKPRVNLGKQISPLRLNNKSPRPVPSPLTKEEILPPLIQYRSGLGTVVSNFIKQPTIQSQFNTIQTATAHGNFVNTGVRSLSSSLFKQKQQALKSNREDKPTVVVQQTKQLNPITQQELLSIIEKYKQKVGIKIENKKVEPQISLEATFLPVKKELPIIEEQKPVQLVSQNDIDMRKSRMKSFLKSVMTQAQPYVQGNKYFVEIKQRNKVTSRNRSKSKNSLNA
ncbi:hypothetical protein FGO68_gene10715 [Halteria grandinella]|uniref:Uncharacterized protein n=1 Tax=Halteria grandinella TaxID=5974 RepID=A0A8J8T1R6_HALGN|nr:hypothetical protein FGO68_gene10715 [Halteria grandinella]